MFLCHLRLHIVLYHVIILQHNIVHVASLCLGRLLSSQRFLIEGPDEGFICVTIKSLKDSKNG